MTDQTKKPKLTFTVQSAFPRSETSPTDEFSTKLKEMQQAGTLTPQALDHLIQQTGLSYQCLAGVNYNKTPNNEDDLEVIISFWSRTLGPEGCPDKTLLESDGGLFSGGVYDISLRIARDGSEDKAISKQRSQAWMRFVGQTLASHFDVSDDGVFIDSYDRLEDVMESVLQALEAHSSVTVLGKKIEITIWPKSLGPSLPVGDEYDGVTGEQISTEQIIH